MEKFNKKKFTKLVVRDSYLTLVDIISVGSNRGKTSDFYRKLFVADLLSVSVEHIDLQKCCQ